MQVIEVKNSLVEGALTFIEGLKKRLHFIVVLESDEALIN